MTQEDKKLLLKDLCSRLPYGVKVKIKHYDDAWELLAIYTNGTTYAAKDIGYPIETYFENCKPYLFPLSSMTEEQKIEYHSLIHELNVKAIEGEISNADCSVAEVDWLNKNNFDYRGLIPKGLAIDATDLNIY